MTSGARRRRRCADRRTEVDAGGSRTCERDVLPCGAAGSAVSAASVLAPWSPGTRVSVARESAAVTEAVAQSESGSWRRVLASRER